MSAMSAQDRKKGHQLQTNSIGEGFVKSWNSDGLEG